ncbi:MAG TPA: packaged DNA stabilization protein [Rummeliibacillus sp.]|nr:packaged DNA stabilization protein [Rummeliibacillus sp.]
MRTEFPLTGSFGKANFNQINAERLINMYVVQDEQAKKPKYSAPFPGIGAPVDVPDLMTGGFRASLIHFDTVTGNYYVYAAVADKLYSIDNALTVVEISDLTHSLGGQSGYVAIADINNAGNTAKPDQILFTDGIKLILYIQNGTGAGISNITLPSSSIPQYVTSMDGYFICAAQGTLKFYVSDLLDGTTWNALSFASADTRAGKIVAVKTLKRRLFIFGDKSIESWINVGASNFPFRRDNNILIEHGLLAAGSLTEGSGRLFYLAQSQIGTPAIMMIDGTEPNQISSQFLEMEIDNFNHPEDAVGFCFRIDAQFFYQINFTSDDKSYLYNINSNTWSELESAVTVGPGGYYIPHRHAAQTQFYFYNITYVGDFNKPKFYTLSNAYFTNNGDPIVKSGIVHVFFSPIYNRREITRVFIDMLHGVDVPPNDFNGTQNNNPVVFFSLSADGGDTYEDFNPEQIGKTGQRLWRTYWYRLGSYYSMTMKWVIYNSIPVYILGGAIDYEEFSE